MKSSSYEEKALLLGRKLANERDASEISIERAAAQLGVSPELIESMEKGETIPSLPELELLASLYRVPLAELINENENPEQRIRIKVDKRPAFILLRTRLISATLKQARASEEISIEELSKELDIPQEILEEYESGTTPIPQPVLAELCKFLKIDMDSLLSPLTTRTAQTAIADLPVEMDAELREFVASPSNLPYLQLAKKLSETDAAKLRQIAENILEITY